METPEVTEAGKSPLTHLFVKIKRQEMGNVSSPESPALLEELLKFHYEI